MRDIRIPPLFSLLTVFGITLQGQAQVQTVERPHYSSLWRNITRQQIREDIQRYKDNGVGLEEVMMRSLLQDQFVEYLTEISTACKANPKQANLFASYGWALALSRSGSLTQRQPIPKELSSRFNFNQQFIWDTIQHARDLDRRCWLADVAEAALSFGGLMGHPTEGARLTERAYNIQRIAVTMTQYGTELLSQSFVMQDPQMKRKGTMILLEAQQLYPTYWRLPWAVAYAFGGRGPLSNPVKQKAAAQRFIAPIPLSRAVCLGFVVTLVSSAWIKWPEPPNPFQSEKKRPVSIETGLSFHSPRFNSDNDAPCKGLRRKRRCIRLV